jgi:hypothetical protein
MSSSGLYAEVVFIREMEALIDPVDLILTKERSV